MPRPALNKQALNTLTELYLKFVHLVEYKQYSKESKQELDIFYLRGIGNSGGLRTAIIGAYEASNLNQEEAGTPEAPLTLERLLPCKTINSYNDDDKVNLVQDVYADLKYYNDAVRGHVAGMDDESIVVKEKAEELLRSLRLRDSSGTEDTQVDLRTAHIAHENHSLVIGHVRIKLQANSIGDLATNYMVNEMHKGETVDSHSVSDWVSNHPNYIGNPTNAKGIHSALNKINIKVKDRTQTTEELFDTSPRNGVIRNF